MALLTAAQTAAEIKRKAAAGIPLTNTTNAANNTAYKSALTGVPVPNMNLSTPNAGGVSGVTVPKSPLSTTANNTSASGVTVPNMNLATNNSASSVTVPNGYSASNPTGGYQPSPIGGVTLPRTEQTLNTQSGLVNTPWNYNAADDQSLQAAIRDADNKLLINQKNTNAQLRATGQGKSSYSETVANQLANQSAENIANTLVPQYESMAYQKNQDQIGNLRNLYQDYNQQDFQNPITESATTGVYQNAATKDALFKIMMYKAEAEGPNVTAARRSELSKLADQQRAIIDANGGDSTQVGANVNSKNINQSGIGVRTLAGQNQDFNQATQTRQLDTADKQYAEEFAYQKARDSISDKQWQTKFDEDVRQNGLSYGLQQLSQQNDQAYRQAQLALSQDDNSRAWLDYENSLNTPAEAAKYSGMSANQVYDSLKTEFTKTDKLGKPLPITSADKDAIYQRVLSVGLPDGQDTQVMALLGLTPTEIATFDKKYLGE